MDRPRIAAIVSGAAASAAAFLVVSRSSLLGTPVGAAIIPVVYTLVSYVSSVGLDRAGEWLEFRMPSRGSAKATHEDTVEKDRPPAKDGPLAERFSGSLASDPESETGDDKSAVTYYRTPQRRRLAPQWLLLGSALVALAISIYAVASPQAADTVEKVVFRTEVIEKTVTTTTEVEQPSPARSAEIVSSGAARSGGDTDAPATDTSETGDAAAGAPTTDTSMEDGSSADETSGTTSPTAGEVIESTTPATETAQGDQDPGRADQETGLPPLQSEP